MLKVTFDEAKEISLEKHRLERDIHFINNLKLLWKFEPQMVMGILMILMEQYRELTEKTAKMEIVRNSPRP